MNVPLIAEPIFSLGTLPVTNALLNATLLTAVLGGVAFAVGRNIREVPGRVQNAVEVLIETMLGYADQVTNDRKKSVAFLPFVGSLFVLILFSNWMGLLPGTGSIGVWQMVHGEVELVPLLRPAMSDLNMTVALALLSVVGSHLVGITAIGVLAHLNRFIQAGSLWQAIRTFKPMEILVAIVHFFVGLLEIVSELAKVVSLSLRLFGNIFAGEVLITVMAGLVPFLVPTPFLLLEVLVGIIQASVFAMLTLVYLTVLSDAPHGSEASHEPAMAH